MTIVEGMRSIFLKNLAKQTSRALGREGFKTCYRMIRASGRAQDNCLNQIMKEKQT
jgi:hypothetical protein